MSAQGDYLIVAIPFNRPWIAWSGTSLDGFGLLDQGKHFWSLEEAERNLKDARKDAQRDDDKGLGYVVFVAYLPQGAQKMEVFCPNRQTLMVDFRDDDLSPSQMSALGVL